MAAGRAWFFSKKAARLYTDVVFQSGDVLVFGSETSGLPDVLLQEYAPNALRIPIREQVRSLNLSVAAGIAIYEAMRQFS